MVLLLNDIKNHFKFDKIDKIMISLVFIIGAISSCFFCFGAEEPEKVSFSVLDGVYYDTNNIKIGQECNLVSYNSTIGFVKLEKGFLYKYNVSADSSTPSSRVVSLSYDKPSIGVTTTISSFLKANDSFTINSDTTDFNFLVFGPSAHCSVTRIPVSGLEDSIESLVDSVGFGALWEIFNNAIPYILIVVITSFGIFLIHHNINEISKGKERM